MLSGQVEETSEKFHGALHFLNSISERWLFVLFIPFRYILSGSLSELQHGNADTSDSIEVSHRDELFYLYRAGTIAGCGCCFRGNHDEQDGFTGRRSCAKRRKGTMNRAQITMMNGSIANLFRNALGISSHHPGLMFFVVKALIHQKRAAAKRIQWENEGVHVPPFAIASITSACNEHLAGLMKAGGSFPVMASQRACWRKTGSGSFRKNSGHPCFRTRASLDRPRWARKTLAIRHCTDRQP